MSYRKFVEKGFDPSTYEHRLLLIEQIRKQEPFESLLDVGCGDGGDLWLVERTFPNVSLAGIDRNPTNIEKTQLKTNADLRCGNLEEFLGEKEDGSYDIVMANGVIMYVGGVWIEELLRVAKKAVVLSERSPYKHTDIKKYLEENHEFEEVRVECRDSWRNDGYIWTILKK